MESVAVVDAGPGSVTIWHVDFGASAVGLSRVAGAWVLVDQPETVELLTRGKIALTTESGSAAMRSAGSHPLGWLDVAATITNIAEERDRLQRVYDELPEQRRKNLVPPDWPRIPEAFDMENPPRDRGSGEPVAVALGVARCLDQLAACWEAIEKERTARSYMVPDGEPATTRPIPVVLTEAA